MARNGEDAETESRRILERVKRDSNPGGTLMARVSERTASHVAARDVDQDDPIELWGARVGRVLGLLIMAGLFVWLFLYLSRGG